MEKLIPGFDNPGSARNPNNTAGATPPDLLEQLSDIFISPKKLFQRLSQAPRWGGALGVLILFGVAQVVSWGLNADVDAVQRQILERNHQLSPDQITHLVEMYHRLIIPIGAFGIIFRLLFGNLILGLLFFLVGLTTNNKQQTTYLHAISAATLPNLVMLPYTLLIIIMCIFSDVGGIIPERLAPSGLAFYIQPKNPQIYALLAQVDIFIIGYFTLTYFAVRNIMHIKREKAILCTLIAVLTITGWKIYFWV